MPRPLTTPKISFTKPLLRRPCLELMRAYASVPTGIGLEVDITVLWKQYKHRNQRVYCLTFKRSEEIYELSRSWSNSLKHGWDIWGKFPFTQELFRRRFLAAKTDREAMQQGRL